MKILVEKAMAEAPQITSEMPVLLDRRRPGRTENVSPSLLPLLREQAQNTFRNTGDLRPAKGINRAIWISLVLWDVAIATFLVFWY